MRLSALAGVAVLAGTLSGGGVAQASAGPAVTRVPMVTGCPQSWVQPGLVPCRDVPATLLPEPRYTDGQGNSVGVAAQDLVQIAGCRSATWEVFTTWTQGGLAVMLGVIALNCSNVGTAKPYNLLLSNMLKAGDEPVAGVRTVGTRSILFRSDLAGPDWTVLFAKGRYVVTVGLNGMTRVVAERRDISLAQAAAATI